ncbi:hypothetical protein KBI52_18575 [Microvirga sp. HBU67558]|uniref:hypothetical protein n=1 Tax=Microvirga TaxID=186650 RepID=UPI001B3719FB|nr:MULTISPECIES: hypothetical protein [unclassified Microvirga]MBQ0822200.1 hypothetical protein [Microvirga sp. HBU67558]
MASVAQAANDPLDQASMSEPVQVRFDPAARQTTVSGRAASDLCFFLSLPDEWRRTETVIKAVSSDEELSVGLRSAQDLRDMPQPDLASRDAAALQQDYEELLGRPAQSVSLSSDAGATRWSATWIDPNLPTASHALTVETLIVPLAGKWVLELSLSGIETRSAYNALAQHLLARLKVQSGPACQG